ncbi:MAG: alpha/beta hydrolase [Anaerolineaceae bacterium]|nr:alpha/beta hydrolase [Anaerolineaceae bacterium]
MSGTLLFLLAAALILLAGLFFLLLGLFFLANYFYKISIVRGPKALAALAKKDALFSGEDHGMDENRLWWNTQPFHILTMHSHDGLALKAYFLPAPNPSSKAVLLLHGYRSTAAWLAGFARLFHEELGCNVLLPDCRGHGQSEGEVIGMGWLDRPDILGWVEELERQTGPGARIALWGISMGAAAAMMMSGENLPASVRAVIEDCGYDSVRDEFQHQLQRMYHLPAFPLLPAASLLCNLRAGFSFDEASCIPALQRTQIPTLFIHGAEDDFVPVHMAHTCYAACTAPKELWLAPDAGHGLAFQTHPLAYKELVKRWLEQHL